MFRLIEKLKVVIVCISQSSSAALSGSESSGSSNVSLGDEICSRNSKTQGGLSK